MDRLIELLTEAAELELAAARADTMVTTFQNQARDIRAKLAEVRAEAAPHAQELARTLDQPARRPVDFVDSFTNTAMLDDVDGRP